MKKIKKTCKYLNYAEHFLILVSTVTGCVSISAFASLVFVPVDITYYKFCSKNKNVCNHYSAITAGIKKCKSTRKKKKKKYDKIVLLGKDILNSIEIVISKFLINS